MNINRDYYKIKEFFTVNRNQRLIIVVVTILVSTLFVFIGFLTAQPGFPLDDSWIHQTYARNLIFSGKWEFNPGEESAGSTAPLWTLLLSIGYFFGLKLPYFWTIFLSIVILCGIALLFFNTLRIQANNTSSLIGYGALLLILDWHMLWSTVSGMETILFCFLGLLILNLLIYERNWFWIGLLLGIIVWVRPDGITFLGPVLLIFGRKMRKQRTEIIKILYILVPLFILLILYGWFNYSISGKIFPNTFYAKQIEYASSLALPLWKRVEEIFLIPISGVGLFLLPGFILSIKKAILKRNIWLSSVILWFFGYGLIYAVKLPMTYQHGRYLFPLIPVYFLVGILGVEDLVSNIAKQNYRIKMIFTITSICAVACTLLFVYSGEIAYTNDLQTIESLMIDPALWIKNNTSKDAIIAVHDIGAMGYWGERKIIDLAGLINPEIIPIIRDEDNLQKFIIKNGSDYLVVFKDWYKKLGAGNQLVADFSLTNSDSIEIVEIRKIEP